MTTYGYSDQGNEAITESVVKELDAIGEDVFSVETLEDRGSDDDDFHDVSVWSMREALKRAYNLGKGEK